MALTGRGLLDFLAGVPEHCDDNLAAALETFTRHGDRASMTLANAFYARWPRRGASRTRPAAAAGS